MNTFEKNIIDMIKSDSKVVFDSDINNLYIILKNIIKNVKHSFIFNIELLSEKDLNCLIINKELNDLLSNEFISTIIIFKNKKIFYKNNLICKTILNKLNSKNVKILYMDLNIDLVIADKKSIILKSKDDKLLCSFNNIEQSEKLYKKLGF